MKVSVWFPGNIHPPKKGWYLAHKGMSMGDDETAVGWYHWSGKEWRDGEWSSSRSANVDMWTQIDEDMFDKFGRSAWAMRSDAEVHPTVKAALEDLLDAVDKFNEIKALCEKNSA